MGRLFQESDVKVIGIHPIVTKEEYPRISPRVDKVVFVRQFKADALVPDLRLSSA